MEPTNHPFRKENDLNQTSMTMFHVDLQGCTYSRRCIYQLIILTGFLNHQLGERFVDRDDSYQSGLRPFPGSKKKGKGFSMPLALVRWSEVNIYTRWWFQTFFIVTLAWGRWTHFGGGIFFHRVVQPPTSFTIQWPSDFNQNNLRSQHLV